MKLEAVSYIRFVEEEEQDAWEYVRKLESDGYHIQADTGYAMSLRTITMWQRDER